MSQPAARLPAVKVTLPAAMYYTGMHSQAEYNIALEGRFEAHAGRLGALVPLYKCLAANSGTGKEVDTEQKLLFTIHWFTGLSSVHLYFVFLRHE